jgi:hypothetical protein
MTKTRLDIVAAHAFSDAVATRVQKNRALFAAVRWWRSQAASLWCETPLLHVGLDKDESHLSKVDVHLTGSVCADRRKEVLSLQAVRDIVELLAIASEKESAGPWSISNANDVSLDKSRAVCGGVEGLIVSSVSVGHV